MITDEEFNIILSEKNQKLINDNLDKEIGTLALKLKCDNISPLLLLDQIAAKQKALKKNSNWYQTPNIFYPSPISLEQSSSDITAAYKSQLVDGEVLIDLTGGMGVDSYAFSLRFKKVIYVEQNEMLCKIAKHNFSQLQALNIEVVHNKAEDFLKNLTTKVDCIYLDPARRDSNKNKVFKFIDCSPNVVDLMPVLQQKTSTILIKSSPLLDINQSLKELGVITQIEIVADKNECKELLFLILNIKKPNLEINCINLRSGQSQFRALYQTENVLDIKYDFPKYYLYEPNAAILKSGAFVQIGLTYNLSKLHKNTHLYTSDELVSDFPGRIFAVTGFTKYDLKELKQFVNEDKANITVRNFPDSVEEIRKKLKLKDGGNHYIFASTQCDESLKLIICKKIV